MKSTRGREAASYCSERSTILKLRTEEGVGVAASDVSVAPELFSHNYINLVIQHCSLQHSAFIVTNSACITFNVASVFSLYVI